MRIDELSAHVPDLRIVAVRRVDSFKELIELHAAARPTGEEEWDEVMERTTLRFGTAWDVRPIIGNLRAPSTSAPWASQRVTRHPGRTSPDPAGQCSRQSHLTLIGGQWTIPRTTSDSPEQSQTAQPAIDCPGHSFSSRSSSKSRRNPANRLSCMLPSSVNQSSKEEKRRRAYYHLGARGCHFSLSQTLNAGMAHSSFRYNLFNGVLK
jgi:hypothetical protein